MYFPIEPLWKGQELYFQKTFVENKDEVVELMQKPGRLYTGARREDLASLKITSLFKARKARNSNFFEKIKE